MSYSNFILPPDFVEEEKHTVLIIDPDWSDIEPIATFCKHTDQVFNVYLYNEVNQDQDWLSQAINVADVVIVNTHDSSISAEKDRLTNLSKTWYYGPKNFLVNKNKIEAPVDYFLQYASLIYKGQNTV